jgi:hypothetical protein
MHDDFRDLTTELTPERQRKEQIDRIFAERAQLVSLLAKHTSNDAVGTLRNALAAQTQEIERQLKAAHVRLNVDDSDEQHAWCHVLAERRAHLQSIMDCLAVTS